MTATEDGMDQLARKTHWEQFYATHSEQELSWFESVPALSLDLIRNSTRTKTDSIVDIGGGSSRLVDCLIAEGYSTVAVLDVSHRALAMARERLGADAGKVLWIESDVLVWHCVSPVDIWHDRAAYHFFTDEKDRAAYAKAASSAVQPGGTLIVATFAIDGPKSCSGLPAYRASADMIAADFALSFELVESRIHEHVTPRGAVQRFQIACLCRKQDSLVAASIEH
jgi:trans-aconitate methyltransferase